MHGTIGSYNISAFWYLPKYANRWNKYSKWRSMDWARCLLLIIENSQQISTRPGSALYRSIHSNRRLAIYRTLPHLTLSTDIYLANTQSWRSFSTSWQCSAAQASHSWTYVTAVLTYWIEPKGPAPDASVQLHFTRSIAKMHWWPLNECLFHFSMSFVSLWSKASAII